MLGLPARERESTRTSTTLEMFIAKCFILVISSINYDWIFSPATLHSVRHLGIRTGARRGRRADFFAATPKMQLALFNPRFNCFQPFVLLVILVCKNSGHSR